MPEKWNWVERIVPVLIVVIVVMAFVMGAMWSKLQSLSSGPAAAAQPAASAAPAATVDLNQVKDAFKKSAIKFGDENSKLIVLEIADPSCPYCHVAGGHNPTLAGGIQGQDGSYPFKYVSEGGKYVPPVPEIEKLVKAGKIAFAYIYAPGHGNGEVATRAFYCAQEQGKFWEVHNLLMNNEAYTLINDQVKNDKTKTQQIVDFVKSKVDTTKLSECMNSTKYDAKLTEDAQIASTLAYRGTPHFLINSTPFGGAYSWNDMKSTVDAALK